VVMLLLLLLFLLLTFLLTLLLWLLPMIPSELLVWLFRAAQRRHV
jgi:hypothetical protein